ncbi:C-type lectin domain family 2 member B, partial [Cariama cristata]
CPEDWVGHHNICYYLSEAEGSWSESQEQCSSLGASLALLTVGSSLSYQEFLLRLRGNINYWLGVRRQGGRLEWVDGSSFNQRIPVKGEEPCLFLDEKGLRSSSCSRPQQYICSKPQAVM